ncbi:MAG TPA: hypothetical protein VM100_07055, partial [Longimicrobiales bacterium]|nr:hypothetical protein [Longimicrobiales bacterium]
DREIRSGTRHRQQMCRGNLRKLDPVILHQFAIISVSGPSSITLPSVTTNTPPARTKVTPSNL